MKPLPDLDPHIHPSPADNVLLWQLWKPTDIAQMHACMQTDAEPWQVTPRQLVCQLFSVAANRTCRIVIFSAN